MAKGFFLKEEEITPKPVSRKGKEAELFPESVTPKDVDPLSWPMDAWEFDLPTDAPRDHVLKDGNRLDLPHLKTASLERDVTVLADAGLSSSVLVDTSQHGSIVLDATALGADRTVDISALTVVGRELEISTLNAHGTYQLIVDAGASGTINGYRYWYLNGAYQRVRIRQVSATAWIVTETLGTFRQVLDTTLITKGGAVSGTYYNPGGLSLTLEPGRWRVRYHGLVTVAAGATESNWFVVELGLGTSAAVTPVNTLDSNTRGRIAASTTVGTTFDLTAEVNVAATTTYYLNNRQVNTSAGAWDLNLGGTDETTVIEARRIA